VYPDDSKIKELFEKGWTEINRGMLSAKHNVLQEGIHHLFDISEERKRGYIYEGRWGRTGYLPPKSEKLAEGYGYEDKEVWQLCKEPHMVQANRERLIDNYWPEEQLAAKTTFMRLYRECESICENAAAQLMANFPLLKSSLSLLRESESYLRLIKYNENKNMMCAPHVDRDLLTLVVHQSAPGLRFYDKSGNVSEGSPYEMILSVGEIFSQMTGGQLRCPMHEVIGSHSGSEGRYSIVFFFIPRPDLFFPVVKNESVCGELNVGEFLQNRIERML